MEDGLSPEQQAKLALFCEVAAESADPQRALYLLSSCDWNVERALQLHWASGDRGFVAGEDGVERLGAPLLANDGATGTRGTPSSFWRRLPQVALVGWLARGIRQISMSFWAMLRRAFAVAGNAAALSGANARGGAFARSLLAAYGENLRLPRFFAGSFAEALQRARQESKLLVVYLHCEQVRHTQAFCTGVLGSEFVRTMLDENFLLWGGDVARMEAHQVSQLVNARQYPWFCVLLPASVDEIRVIGAVHGEVQVDQVSALLATCLDEIASRQAARVARREQQAEDRLLREQQDLEYQQALETDRRRAEEKARLEQEQIEMQRLEEEEQRKEREEQERLQAELQAIEDQRKLQAAALPAEGPEATARLSLRLPEGQRLQRRFLPAATLADVYAWVHCAAHLPENEGKGLRVPARFVLKTSFPSKDLTEMSASIEELRLAGSNILLSAIEDDDD